MTKPHNYISKYVKGVMSTLSLSEVPGGKLDKSLILLNVWNPYILYNKYCYETKYGKPNIHKNIWELRD